MVLPNSHSLSFFSYDANKVVGSETSEARMRVLIDWNRQISYGECRYFINNLSLRTLREQMLEAGKCQQLEFQDLTEFKQFLKEYLFQNLDNDKAEIAIQQALLQWHQGGIQHATYRHTWIYALENFSNIRISEPISTVYFNSVPEGVRIIENNTYLEWVEVQPDNSLVKHTPEVQDSSCAQTNTTYLFHAEGIELQDLSIYCASPQLNAVFGNKPGEKMSLSNSFFRALYEFIIRLLTGYTPVAMAEPDDPQTSFPHPPLK